MFVHQSSDNKPVLAERVFIGLNDDSHVSSASCAADAYSLDQAINVQSGKAANQNVDGAADTSLAAKDTDVKDTADTVLAAKYTADTVLAAKDTVDTVLADKESVDTAIVAKESVDTALVAKEAADLGQDEMALAGDVAKLGDESNVDEVAASKKTLVAISAADDCEVSEALVSASEVKENKLSALLSKMCAFDKEYGLGSAEKYDAIDALTITVPEAERMCPENFSLVHQSFTQAFKSYKRINRATVAKHKLPMSIRALEMLEAADESMFAERQEALFTLVLALGGPILELMADPKVCAIALGTDTRVIYENKTDEILVLPQIEQSKIHILVRELVFLNAPERMRDEDISDIHGRVGLGNFYFVADVPPHSSVPVISMWRATSEVSVSGPMIAASQDDPGVYGICDCRFDPKAAALRNMTPKERRTIEFCGKADEKVEGDCEIASVLELDLKLSERAWKMLNKIERKWRTGNYNIESLRMLTYLVGPEIIELLANPEVTEIALNSDRRLFINTYTERSIELSNSSNTNIEALMRLLSSMLDMDLGSDKHILSGILPLDGSRVECNRPPVVPNPTLVIRKHAACSMTLDRLMDLNMLTMTEYVILEHALKARLSILVSGETGSGKTTLLSALINQLADIAPSERVICLEDTPELMPVIANCTHAYTSDSTDMSELVRSALRQHPDRIVVGEVRGPEALDLIDALCTGHKGSFSSMHAGSAEEAIKRLGLMISRNEQAPENYNDLVASGVDIIVQMESRPQPHIRSIKCVNGIEDEQFIIQPIRSTRDIDHYIELSQAQDDHELRDLQQLQAN